MVTTIVVSGVNLKEGGILSVLEDCLLSLKKLNHQNKYRIIALVHSVELVKNFVDCFEIREYPEIKKSWFKRLKFEFLDCLKISEEIKPDIWISLHDITPNVKCKYQYVYCHNPGPFYNLPIKDYLVDHKFTLFNAFYGFLYSLNIKKNRYVIVQQSWLRNEFYRRYKVNSIVAYPHMLGTHNGVTNKKAANGKYVFFYPSFPRVFKNVETLLAATVKLLETRDDFEVVITISGDENKYSRKLFEKYSGCRSIKFIGIQPRETVFDFYSKIDCMVFPSKLETWGLPLSEFKQYNKPIIVSDLQFAHEAIGVYDTVKFFNPQNATQLAQYMEQAIEGKLVFDKNEVETPGTPFFSDWDSLVGFLVEP